MATIVGIDPSSNRSGVAIMQDGRYIQLVMLDLVGVMRLARELPSDTIYHVEDPAAMKAPHKELIADKKDIGKLRNMSVSVARCRQAAISIIDVLEQMRRTVIRVKPQQGFSKKAKRDREWFNRVTGWTRSSNKDTRDAAMLIFSHLKERR